MKSLFSVLLLSLVTVLSACQKRPVPGVILEDRPPLPSPQVSQPFTAVEYERDAGEEQKAEDEQEVAEIPANEKLLSPVSILREEVFAAELSRFEFASHRQKVYEKKIDHWRMLLETMESLDIDVGEPSLSQECIEEMERVLAGYDAITEGLSEESSLQFAVWQNDISFIESDCEIFFIDHMTSVAEQMDHYTRLSVSQAEKVVSHYDEQKEYERVIALYRRLAISTARKPDLLTQEIYGNALQRTGRLKEASEVMLRVADSCENSKKWTLRLRAADMLTAAGSFEEALEQYQLVAEDFGSWRTVDRIVQAKVELLDTVQEGNEALQLYAQALNSWMTGSGMELPGVLLRNVKVLEKKYGESIYAEEGNTLRILAEESVHSYVEEALEEVRSLVAEKKFNKAQRIVKELTQLKTPEETGQLLKITEDGINQAEIDEKILQQQLKDDALAAQWQQANLLFDQKEYDKAIDLFKGLVNSGYQGRALSKLDKAIQLAAGDMRKKAALLFSKSRKISGIEKKGALLLESRSILQEIIRRYPEAQIIDKVVVNLDVIEKQILNLDPSLLDDSGFEERQM